MAKKLLVTKLSLFLFLTGVVFAHQIEIHQYIPNIHLKFVKLFPLRKVGVKTLRVKQSLSQKHDDNYDIRFTFAEKKMNTNSQKIESNVKDKVFYYGKQFIRGELCGVGCSFLSAVIAGPFYPKGKHGIVGAGYVASVMYIGYTVGNSIGVYWSGKTKYKSSYLKTLVGSIIGATVGLYIFDQCDAKGPLCSALVLGPPIGSILGFNLSRKSGEMTHGRALINYCQGKLRWSLRGVRICCDCYHDLVLKVSLFQVDL